METAPGPGQRRRRREALLAVIGPVGSEEERAAVRGALERGKDGEGAFPARRSSPVLLPQGGRAGGQRGFCSLSSADGEGG